MKYPLIALACLLSLPAWALDNADQQRLAGIQQQWAKIQYQTPEAQRAAAFEQLSQQAEGFTRERPAAAEAWIWSGIVHSSWAGAQGGLGALSKVKLAREELEKAMAIDPQALQGSAYTSLAALYDRVPGWPVGFGDADKADKLLQQALKINPQGIDTLYFWGDHLFRQGHYAQARDALKQALQAAPRPGREVADAGRRQEIQQLLADVDKKLN
ncbi:tetratricopeptide repeat protein [Pseudomonas sp. DTU_2021_1001937_2_SI_NGA_ILE_001]|uniref:tetratricopeptide repeat protein n=1 Tax=Pseudomonas sp. DTU_2021_1001937_2_SI_NGA_ILE_001 TaxID=3077589 RepID=UPI0025FBC1D8|nr:tetratricopeptide repeat protein [Pseudomonas sp. DTU_2021_1001937_2_SI_NGA_ILE_001]WNW11534.1 tetratricopeptide repeat protein [Pseudomonas sp. DTU_2021_1001937_2_SI_NGA_ILE_001]